MDLVVIVTNFILFVSGVVSFGMEVDDGWIHLVFYFAQYGRK